METATKKNDMMYWVHIGIVLCFMLFFGYIPPIEPITVEGMKCLGIFLGMLYGWITCGPIWPSFLGVAMMILYGFTTVTGVITAGIGSETCMFVLFVFIFTYQISQTKLDSYLATWLLSRKFIQGRPWVFTAVFLVGCAIITGITVNPFAMIIIFWTMFYDIAKSLGYKPYDPYPTLMVIGVVLACSLGQCMMPFSALVIIIGGIASNMTDLVISPLTWLMFSIPAIIVLTLTYVLICKFIFRPNVDPVKNFSVDMIDNTALVLTKEKSCMLFILLAYCVCLISPKLLPATSIIGMKLSSLGNWGITVAFLFIMCVIRIDKKPFMDFNACAKNGVVWAVLGMMTAVLPMGGILTSEVTGIQPFLVQFFTNLLGGMSPMLFVMICCALTVLLTNLINDAIVGMIMIVVAASCASVFSFNMLVAAILIIFGSHMAILLPSSAPYAAMMHGNTDWLRQQDIYKYASVSFVILMIVLSTIGYFWCVIVA